MRRIACRAAAALALLAGCDGALARFGPPTDPDGPLEGADPDESVVDGSKEGGPAARRSGEVGRDASVEMTKVEDASGPPLSDADAATRADDAGAESASDAGASRDAEPPNEAGAPSDAGTDASGPITWPTLPTCTDALIAASAADPGPTCPPVAFGTEDPCFGEVLVRPHFNPVSDLDSAHMVFTHDAENLQSKYQLDVVRKADGREVCRLTSGTLGLVPAPTYSMTRGLPMAEGRLLLRGFTADGPKLVALQGIRRDLTFGEGGSLPDAPTDQVVVDPERGFFLARPEGGVVVIRKFDLHGKPDPTWVPVRRAETVRRMAATGDGGLLVSSTEWSSERVQPFALYTSDGTSVPMPSASAIADLFDPLLQAPSEPDTPFRSDGATVTALPSGLVVTVLQYAPGEDWLDPGMTRGSSYVVSRHTGFSPFPIGSVGFGPNERVLGTATEMTAIVQSFLGGRALAVYDVNGLRSAPIPWGLYLVAADARGALLIESASSAHLRRFGL